MDFLSDKLWSKYIAWEKEQKNFRRVTQLYDRLLNIPTQLYRDHFDGFSEHVNANNPKDITSLDDFLRVRKEVVIAKPDPVATDMETEVDDEDKADDEAPPGLEGPPGAEAPPGLEDAPPGAEPPIDEAELKRVREKIIEEHQDVHKKTEEEVSRRWGYEEGIRRPYFHVKPLERAQIKNWKEYLDFEIENGCHERVVVLFERCMVACALYEEFWIKYAKYLEPHSPTTARKVYGRACKVHLPSKPNLHLRWAAFEEAQHNYDEALDIIVQLEKKLPGLIMISMRRVGLLRRRRKYSELRTLFQEYINAAEPNETKSFFAIKYARFLNKVMDSHDAAKEILEEVLELDKSNVKVHLQLIDLEYQQKPIDEEALMEAFSKAIDSDLALDHRVAFSQRKLEYLEDLGYSVGSLMEAYDGHQKLIKEMQASKKRKAPTNEEASLKKTKTADTTASNGAGDQSVATTSTAATTPATSSYSQSAPAASQAPSAGHHANQQHNYNYNPWGGYHQGYHGGWNQGWNYGYGGYGQ